MVKPGFTQSVSVFTVTVTVLFCYFDRLLEDSGPLDPDIGYELCSVQVDGVISLCVKLGYR
jgi:hypothetical protein